METLVDTSVLVAAFSNSDSLHEQGVKALTDCRQPLIIHEYVLLESATVLMSRVSKQVSDTFLTSIITSASVQILYSSPTHFFGTLHSFLGSKTKQLSFVDAALLSLADQYQVLTFDDALQRAITKKKASTTQ